MESSKKMPSSEKMASSASEKMSRRIRGSEEKMSRRILRIDKLSIFVVPLTYAAAVVVFITKHM